MISNISIDGQFICTVDRNTLSMYQAGGLHGRKRGRLRIRGVYAASIGAVEFLKDWVHGEDLIQRTIVMRSVDTDSAFPETVSFIEGAAPIKFDIKLCRRKRIRIVELLFDCGEMTVGVPLLDWKKKEV